LEALEARGGPAPRPAVTDRIDGLRGVDVCKKKRRAGIVRHGVLFFGRLSID
jgi:hypothetical protein